MFLSIFSWSSCYQCSAQYTFQADGFPFHITMVEYDSVERGMNPFGKTMINPRKECWQSRGPNPRPPVLKSCTLPLGVEYHLLTLSQTKQGLVFTSLQYKSFKNTGKRRNFYPFGKLCHFYQIRNRRLKTLSVWQSLKFVVYEKFKAYLLDLNIKSSTNAFNSFPHNDTF